MSVIEIQINHGCAGITIQTHLSASGVCVPRPWLALVRRFSNIETITKAWHVAKLKRRGVA
jgi:hypothetical protein